MRLSPCCSLMGVLALGCGVSLATEPGDLATDVCVVGGGAGGCGAALAAARAGARVVLVEREPRLGGTNTSGYVAAWQAGPSDSFAREIYDRLRRAPGAPLAGIAHECNLKRERGPFALWLIDPQLDYAHTLRRSQRDISQCAAVVFDPDALDQVFRQMLAEAGDCRVLLRTSMVDVRSTERRVVSIEAEPHNGTRLKIHARVFIDSTGGVALCRKLGCETMLGSEPQERFQEPSALTGATGMLNGISLCYRIRKTANPRRQAEIEGPVSAWPHSAHVTEIPGGDLMVNPLTIVPGTTLVERGYDETLALAQRTAQAHWRWLQGLEPFAQYELQSLAPMLGIRETYRVVGPYVLTEHDLRQGFDRQPHKDMVALADHRIDLHGGRGQTRLIVVEQPYGIPYRCLIPKGWDNVLVACRGVSVSHIAASSCRLSRTILALGHAAGLAAAQAVRRDVNVDQIDVRAIQQELQIGVDQGPGVRETGGKPAVASPR